MKYLRRQCLLQLGSIAVLTGACSALSFQAFAERAPGLNLKDLNGNKQKLSALRGQIVVLNFWATWCGPCQEELPRLVRLSQEWSGKDIRFVAVSLDEPKDRAGIAPLLARLQVRPSEYFAVWIGSDSYTLRSFGLGEIVPGTVVIDRDGGIVTHIMGEAKDEDVRSAVEWLLNGRSGSPPPSNVKRY